MQRTYEVLLALVGVAIIILDAFTLDRVRKLQSHSDTCGDSAAGNTLLAVQLYRNAVHDLEYVTLIALIFDCVLFAKYLLKGFVRQVDEILETIVGKNISFVAVMTAVALHFVAFGMIGTAHLDDLATLVNGTLEATTAGVPVGCTIGNNKSDTRQLVVATVLLYVVVVCVGHAYVFTTTVIRQNSRFRETYVAKW